MTASRIQSSWLAALHDPIGGTLVAIDGKTLRRSFDKATARNALHLVTAWAVSQKLSLGSVTVKGNQPTLHEGIVGHFLEHMDDDFARVEVSRHETIILSRKLSARRFGAMVRGHWGS